MAAFAHTHLPFGMQPLGAMLPTALATAINQPLPD